MSEEEIREHISELLCEVLDYAEKLSHLSGDGDDIMRHASEAKYFAEGS